MGVDSEGQLRVAVTKLLGDPSDRAARLKRERSEGVARGVELQGPHTALLRAAALPILDAMLPVSDDLLDLVLRARVAINAGDAAVALANLADVATQLSTVPPSRRSLVARRAMHVLRRIPRELETHDTRAMLAAFFQQVIQSR